MNVIGEWRIKEFMELGDDGFKWVSAEDYKGLHKDDLDDTNRTLSMKFVFTSDGKVATGIPIPEGVSQEEIDMAVKEQGIIVEDGYMLEYKAWKEEDGKILYNTEINGTFLDEEVSPWTELEINDGLMTMLMYRLEKVK